MKHGWHDFSAKIFLSYTLRVLIWQPLWRSRTSFIEKKRSNGLELARIQICWWWIANSLPTFYYASINIIALWKDFMNYEIFGPQSGSSLTREASSPFIIWLRKCVYGWLSVIVSFSLGPNCARKYPSGNAHTTHPQMRTCHGKSCRPFYYQVIQTHTLFYYPPVCRSPVYSFSVGLYCPKLWAVLRIYSATIHS